MDLERARRDAKALLRAVRAGEPEAVARLRAQDVPVRERVLLADAQLAIARELGAPSWPALTHTTDRDRWASLGRAAVEGDHVRVRALLESGVDVGPSMALTTALARDDAELVALLLSYRDPELPAEWWPELRDALIAAVHRCCSTAVMEVLRAGGADPEAVDEYGRAVPLLAWRWGRDDFPDPGAVSDADRFSRACWRGDAAAARALASADGLEDEALVWAARAGNVAAVELIADVGGLPVDRRGFGGMTALQHAQSPGPGRDPHDEVIRALLARGADPARTPPERIAIAARGGLDTRLHEAWMRNLAATIAGAEVWPVGEGFALRTGIDDDNTWNGVVASRASDAEIRTTIERLSGVPAIWTVPEGGAVGRRLVAAGAEEETTAVVVQRERSALVLDRGAPSLTFGAADAESWFALGDETLQADPRAASEALRLVVVREAGRVVGVGALLVDGSAALVVDLLVAAGRRHRGIGTALVAHLLSHAPDVDVVLAEPTPDSQPFWWLLGFAPAPATPKTTYYLP